MSLTWKPDYPKTEGWFWVRLKNGCELPVQFARLKGGLWSNLERGIATHYAGPISKPVEPKPETLLLVRYRTSGTFLPPRTHYWDSNRWEYTTRAEMLRRVRLNLFGQKNYWSDGSDCEADSSEVTLWTNRRVNGRWPRRSQPEKFTVANIDAAIAACSLKAEAVA